jgi:hypothetical protein
LKRFFSILFFTGCFTAKAQKVDSMYVNLYTDSLKKGTYNYINVDGLLSDGKWLPLDSNYIEFKCSHGKFYGNELWIDSSFAGDKISIETILRSDRKQHQSFDLYIKKKPDDALPSEQDILNNLKKKKKSS